MIEPETIEVPVTRRARVTLIGRIAGHGSSWQWIVADTNGFAAVKCGDRLRFRAAVPDGHWRTGEATVMAHDAGGMIQLLDPGSVATLCDLDYVYRVEPASEPAATDVAPREVSHRSAAVQPMIWSSIAQQVGDMYGDDPYQPVLVQLSDGTIVQVAKLEQHEGAWRLVAANVTPRVEPAQVVADLMQLVDAYHDATEREALLHDMVDGPTGWVLARATENRKRAREAVETAIRRALGGT